MSVSIVRVRHPSDDYPKCGPPCSIKMSSPGNVKEEVKPRPTAPSNVSSKTTVTIVRVTKSYVAQYRHVDMLLRINQIKDSQSALLVVCNANVHSLVKCFRADGSDHARKRSSVSTISVAFRFKESEGAPRPLLAILMKLCQCISWMESIGLKVCVTFRWQGTLPGLRLFCRCDASHYTTTA